MKSLKLKLCMVSVLAVSLCGCASWLQGVSTFNASADVAAKATAEIYVSDVKKGLCAITLDTFSRHTELTEAVTSLCFSTQAQAAAAQSTPAAAIVTLRQKQQAQQAADSATLQQLNTLLAPVVPAATLPQPK